MENIKKATFEPPCKTNGGYIVQPAAGAPPSMNKVLRSMVKAKGRIQKDQLFILGNAMSGAPIIIGTIQFANPTKAGITAPKTIINACMVVI